MKYQDYFKAQRFHVNQLYFDYEGNRVHGRGILDWVPHEGFKLEACLNIDDCQNLKLPSLKFPKFGILKTYCIRMYIHGYYWAIATDVVLDYAIINVIAKYSLNLTLDTVLFCDQSTNVNDYRGTGLYFLKNWKFTLPDVSYQTKEVDGKTEEKWSRDSIDYKEENLIVSGKKSQEQLINLSFQENKENRTKQRNKKWLDSARYSLSMCFCQNLQLIYKELHSYSKTYTEVTRANFDQVNRLGYYLSPFGQEFELNKFLFIKLTKFFVSNSEQKADICYKIFDQMLEARRQKTWYAKELLIATILEAALRTLEKKPYQEGDKSCNIEGGLKRFRDQYLSRDWKKICKPDGKIIQTYRDLRHRNAHPDWLFTERGYLSKEQREKSLNDMIFLSRFYGYIILAIAGIKDYEPRFPSQEEFYATLTDLHPRTSKEKEADKNAD